MTEPAENVTESTPEDYTDNVSKYDFDNAVNIADLDTEQSGVYSGFAECPDVLYKLWDSETLSVSVFGIYTNEAQVLIMLHDDIVDEFACDWFGVYNSTITFEENEGTTYAFLYKEGGYGSSVTDMTIFGKNSDGGYSMYAADIEKLMTEIQSCVSVSVDNSVHEAVFMSGDASYTADIDGYGDNDLAPSDIFCSYELDRDFFMKDGTLHCKVPYSYMMSDFVIVDAEIVFDGTELTVTDISFGSPIC